MAARDMRHAVDLPRMTQARTSEQTQPFGENQPPVEARSDVPHTPGRRSASNLLDFMAQLGASVVGRGLYLVLQMILARVLGPQDFGLYAIGWAVMSLVSTLSPVGMPQSVQRFRIGGRDTLLSHAMGVTVAVGVLSGLAVAGFADVIADHVFATPTAGPVIRAFAAAVPLFGLFSFLTSAMRTQGAVTASALIGAWVYVVYLALVASIFLLHPSAALAAHLYTLAQILACLPAILLLLRTPGTGEPAPRLGVLLRFGIVTMLVHCSNVLNLSVDRVIVGIMAGPETVGIYQIASQLALAGIMLRSAVEVVFESNVARIGTRHGIPDLSREYHAAWRLLLHASGPGLIILAVTAGFWVRLLFGTAYDGAIAPLVILTAGQLISTLAGPSLTSLHMSGAERLVLGLTISCAVLNVLGNILLIPTMGSSGAAMASAVANVVVTFVSLGVCLRSGRLHTGLARTGDVLLGLVICLAASWGLARWLGTLDFFKVGLLLLWAYLLYALTIMLLCRTEDELLAFVRRRLRPKQAERTVE